VKWIALLLIVVAGVSVYRLTIRRHRAARSRRAESGGDAGTSFADRDHGGHHARDGGDDAGGGDCGGGDGGGGGD
jgi:hypothetical protein